MPRSTDRALDVLEYLAGSPPASAAALAKELRIPRATVFRLLGNLVGRGYVIRDKGRGLYTLGLRVLSLSAAVLNRLDIREAAHEAMHQLLADSEETVELLVPHDGEMIFVEKMDSPQSMRIFARIGTTINVLHLMAHGKVALAFMPEKERREWVARPLRKDAKGIPVKRARLEQELSRIRRRFWGVDNQESRIGVTRFSAPVFDHLGQLAATVGFAGPSTRLPMRKKKEFGGMVTTAARGITAKLGGKYPI